MSEADGNAPLTKADLVAVEERLLERIEKSETNLLKAFRNWAVRFETRFQSQRDFGRRLQ